METYLKYIPILTVICIYAARMMEVATKRTIVKGPIQEKTTFRLFMLSGLIAAFGGIAEYSLKGMHPNWALVITGVILALFSFAIRRAAIAALGKFWSLHIEIRENHQFVQSGPFRWVRHPAYFSMILELLSGILICSAFIAGTLAFLIFIPAIIIRLGKEEKALLEKFGEPYKTYAAKTPQILPLRFHA